MLRVGFLVMLCAGGCSLEQAVGKAVDSAVDVGGAVLDNPVVNKTVHVAFGVADEVLSTVLTSDCASDVDLFVGSACEAECDQAKASGDAEWTRAACPEFAR